MNKSFARRLQKLGDALGSLPVDQEQLREAFDWFRKFGELPEEDQRLAGAVISWCRWDVDPSRFDSSKKGQADYLLAMFGRPRDRDDPLMNQLREEAVYGDELVQPIARMVLARLSTQGHDVTEPLFVQKRIELPIRTICCGSVAFALSGFPWRYLPPKYELVTAGLVARLEALHEAVGGNRVWLGDFSTACGAFRRDGVLPQDELMRVAVICDGLFQLLLQARVGQDKPELIAAFDRWHQAEGEEREAVEGVLVEAARAGRLLPFPDGD